MSYGQTNGSSKVNTDIITHTPEPVKKPPTPKPPTPPPSPTFQWDNLDKYSHHPWFEPLKRHCQLKEIKIRQYEDFIPALVDLFICSCDISVKVGIKIISVSQSDWQLDYVRTVR